MLSFDLVLVGFGNVARRFVRLLDERRERLVAEHQLDARVVGIATRRHGCAFDWGGLDASDVCGRVERGESVDAAVRAAPGHPSGPVPDTPHLLARLAARPTTRPCVLLETTPLEIWSGQPAIDHIRAALAAGVHVITANKGPIAHAYDELARAARDARVELLFEGTVMDGIPIFNLVRETLPAVTVVGFRGVVNSTTNFILSAMESGHDFDTALERMQAQGIAEADPSLDVDGWDAAAKTAALMNVLMHARVTPADIVRSGIRGVTAAELRRALDGGRRYKLVASATLEGGRPVGAVRLTELAATDPLAQLEGMSNALVLRTDLLGELAVTQIDSGLGHTAYALLSDLVTLSRRLGRASG